MNYNQGDIIGGKYQILEFIGGGAMGAVYKAENLNMKKQVAIKVLHGDFAEKEEYQRRFMREARSAAALEHSNICTIMDFDTTADGDSYIVMELLAGETLKQRIARLGSLTPYAAVRIMRQIVGALSCAHKNGIVHRDVKPDNIFLIEREGSDDFVKLIDFGIAHIESREGDLKTLTQVGQIYGTPQYVSPEQAEGDPVDHRADLYAAGVIFYEMLSGVPPFIGKNYIELLLKQVNEPAPHIAPELDQSARMDAIIQKLLAKKPADRYASALDVIQQLDELLILMSSDNPGTLANIGSHSLVMSLQSIKENQQDAGSDNIIDALPRGKRQWQIILLIALIIALALIIILHFVSNAVQNARENASGEAVQAEQIDENNAEETADNEQTDDTKPVDNGPQPFDIESVEYEVKLDAVLSVDPAISASIVDYYNKRYKEALESLNSVKEKYWDHPNFIRLYILTNRQDKKHFVAISALAHLFAIEPNAVRNPYIARISNEYFGSREQYWPAIKQEIVAAEGRFAALNVSRLIIRTEYDSSEVRLKRLIETYKALNDENVPQWLKQAVTIWELDKTDCERRRKLVTRLATNDQYRNEIYTDIIIPMSERHSKECKIGKARKDCNECMRPWLASTVEEYKANVNNSENSEPETPSDGNSLTE